MKTNHIFVAKFDHLDAVLAVLYKSVFITVLIYLCHDCIVVSCDKVPLTVVHQNLRHLNHLRLVFNLLFQTNNVQTCLRNATRPLYNKTCKPRPLGFMTKAWITSQRTTLTVAGWVWNGATRTGNTILNDTLKMTGNVYDGAMFVADWTLDKMTWMAEETWDRVMWLTECTWDRVMWLAESIWYHLSWLAGGVWNIVAWFGNVIAALYAEYVKSE